MYSKNGDKLSPLTLRGLFCCQVGKDLFYLLIDLLSIKCSVFSGLSQGIRCFSSQNVICDGLVKLPTEAQRRMNLSYNDSEVGMEHNRRVEETLYPMWRCFNCAHCNLSISFQFLKYQMIRTCSVCSGPQLWHSWKRLNTCNIAKWKTRSDIYGTFLHTALSHISGLENITILLLGQSKELG